MAGILIDLSHLFHVLTSGDMDVLTFDDMAPHADILLFFFFTSIHLGYYIVLLYSRIQA